MSSASIPQLLVSHWEVAPWLEAQALAVAVVDLWGTRRVRGRWPRRRSASFLAGELAILVALQSGLDRYDGLLLSAHMVQHLLLLLIAPLLLLWGRPVMLALRALPSGGRRWAAGVSLRAAPVGHPATGLLVFYLAVIGLNVPAVLEATRPALLHDLTHLAYLGAGLVFLWPLFGHPAGRHTLSSVWALCYVIASMPSCALVGSLLNRYPTPLYASYVRADQASGISALTDQQYAGVIMWVGAHVVLTAVALWVLATKLVAEERRQQVRDALEDRAGLGGEGEGVAMLS